MAAGWTMLRHLGATGIPVAQVENASASGSSAFRHAAIEVAAGLCDVGLAVGVDKVDIPRLASARTGIQSLTGPAIFPAAAFALEAKRHMARYGTTPEQLALVSVKNHHNGARNPNAQSRKERTLDEVLQAPAVVDPFTTLHCCRFGEGAAAALVASEEAIERLGVTRSRAVRIAASAAGSDRFSENGRLAELTRETVAAAFTEASVTPDDLDVVELHDAFAIEEILYTEAIGLCPDGDGGKLVESGETSIGGRCAVNPSGGLISMGHPFGPTGIGQIGEIITQLRGEASGRQQTGARVGLAHMVGLGEVCVAHILISENGEAENGRHV
jgi:acetyl-CoA acetyltransferase